MGLLVVLCFVVFFGGIIAICIVTLNDGRPQDKAPVVVLQTADQDRFEITLASVVKDDLAYGNRRGIYILKDKQTGEEFVGISGVGISSLGKHGKNNRDER